MTWNSASDGSFEEKEQKDRDGKRRLFSIKRETCNEEIYATAMTGFGEPSRARNVGPHVSGIRYNHVDWDTFGKPKMITKMAVSTRGGRTTKLKTHSVPLQKKKWNLGKENPFVDFISKFNARTNSQHLSQKTAKNRDVNSSGNGDELWKEVLRNRRFEQNKIVWSLDIKAMMMKAHG